MLKLIYCFISINIITTIGKLNFADDWIRTVELWSQKQLLYQLSHNRCPTNIFVKLPATAQENETTVQQWAQNRSIRLEYIEPGKPQQNAYVERFNRTVRYEWLAQQLFDTIEEVQEFATQWMWNYNHERPHMALGGITPYQRRAMTA